MAIGTFLRMRSHSGQKTEKQDRRKASDMIAKEWTMHRDE
jgi:hypothetical protein